MFRNKNQKKVMSLIFDFCDIVGQAVEDYGQTIGSYLAGEKPFKEGSKAVSEAESEADRVRYRVEHLMFEGSFLPVDREDYIALVEVLDRVANKAEDACKWLYLVRPAVPDDIVDDIREIGRLTIVAYRATHDLVHRVLDGDYEISNEVIEVAHTESDIDKIQWHATKRVYKSTEIDRLTQLELHTLIERLGAVSDRIENAADRLNLVAIKRRLT